MQFNPWTKSEHFISFIWGLCRITTAFRSRFCCVPKCQGTHSFHKMYAPLPTILRSHFRTIFTVTTHFFYQTSNRYSRLYDKNCPWWCRWIGRILFEGGGHWWSLKYLCCWGGVAIAARSFVKDIPLLVTGSYFLNAFTFDALFFYSSWILWFWVIMWHSNPTDSVI